MKKTTLLASLVCLGLSLAAADWKTDFNAAKEQAKKEKKLVLLDFTGSDWCGWCIKMKKETFDQKAFLEYADKNLVLVEVDFPQTKRLSPAQTKANEKLQSKYHVEGFPTFVVVNGDGKEVGRQEEYVPGGPAAFIAKIESFKK